jgi:hypothetical protein
MSSREKNNRVVCASHLRQLGQALLLYANENKGAYPRTVASTDQDPKPVWGTPYERDKNLGAMKGADPFADELSPVAKYRPAPDDVTAAWFLLLRTEDITTDVFVCPSTGLRGWDMGGKRNTSDFWTNWAGIETLAKSLSYSYQNPYPSRSAIAAGFSLTSAVPPDFAVAADMNPGGDGVVNVKLSSAFNAMKKANSLNHDQEGQNVLCGDGHVAFQNNPFCGMQRDNIYTANGDEIKGEKERTGKGTTIASPVGPSDSILLPTAADLGIQAQPEPAALPQTTK